MSHALFSFSLMTCILKVARLEKVRELRSKTEDDDEAEEDRNLEDADIFSETTSVGGSLATTTRSKSTLATRQTFRYILSSSKMAFSYKYLFD